MDYPAAIIEWLDTTSDSGKILISESASAQYSICKTIGFITHHDAEKIVVAQSIYHCPNCPELLMSDYSTIPTGCIVKITEIKESK